MKIEKRDGKIVDFDSTKIGIAISKAAADFPEIGNEELDKLKENIMKVITDEASQHQGKDDLFSVEDCQDLVVHYLRKMKYRKLANRFQRVREEKAVDRQLRSVFDVLKNEDTKEKTENANVDGYTMSGRHLHISEDVIKIHSSKHLFSKEVMKAKDDGLIYIHDQGWASLGSLTCNQIDIPKLFKGGFSTGHGFLREPGGIKTAFMLSAIAIQSSQNDYHGGQSIPNFDYSLAPYIMKSFRKYIVKHLELVNDYLNLNIQSLNEIEALITNPGYITDFKYDEALNKLSSNYILPQWAEIIKNAMNDTEDEAFQGAEGLVHNLNTMHSRAGAQVPFSSINFGCDVSEAGRLVSKVLLKAQLGGLGKHETPIFPILIYQLKKGINFNPGDPNYDIFRLAMECSSKRLFPTYAFADSSFNLPFYERDHYYGLINTMGALAGHEHLYITIDDGQPLDISIKDFYEYCKTGELKNARPCQLFFNKGKHYIAKEDLKKLSHGQEATGVSGVYQITYLPEDVTYIGSSSNIGRRFNEHRCHINKTGGLDSGIGFKDYNLDNYKFEILEETDSYKEAEVKYIMSTPNINYKGIKNGYYKRVSNRAPSVYTRPKYMPNPKYEQDLIDLSDKNIKVFDRDNKWTKINHVFKNNKKNSPLMMCIHYLENGILYKIDATEDHPFWNGEKYVRTDELTLDDRLYRADGLELKIVDISYNYDLKDSYDIGTATGTFIGSDIMMHNCRTRVMSNLNGREGAIGRGNLSFNSINLPMIALNSGGNLNKFYKQLEYACEMADKALLERLEVQGKQQKRNLPFMAGCGMWLDTDDLDDLDYMAPVLKHGTLSIGFVGLAEALVALTGKHHGESKESDKLGYEIISFIKNYCDKRAQETHMNYSCLGTPAETYCYTALKQVREKYGIIPGVTDREYFTNSSHVPVYYKIGIKDKIDIEGKYHKLENGGHICYVEVDGDISQNLDAFEQILHMMSNADVGYGAVNIPIIWCPNCNKTFRGSFDIHVCPNCGYNELDDADPIKECDC